MRCFIALTIRPSVTARRTRCAFGVRPISTSARGWVTADRKPVKNQDLWQRLDELAAAHTIEWHWVKGHSGVPGNERVDLLANQAIDAMLR